MIFKYIPFLDQMIDLYQKPRTIEGRFDNYLKLIRDGKDGDMSRPLAFFNPMAKEHILTKLMELKNSSFEELMHRYCFEYSSSNDNNIEIQMYFNLADDISGGWTTKESTNAKSLEISPFIKRNLGVVVFYASEIITPELIEERVKFYCDYYNQYGIF